MSKTIVITGASSGIGKALALECAEPGVTLYLLARRREKLSELSRGIEAKGAQAVPYVVDLAVEGGLSSFLNEQLEKSASIDEVYHCAAHSSFGEVQHFSPGDWAELYRVNLLATAEVVAVFYPYMAERKSGRLVLVTSLAGYTGYPTSAPYAAMKEGVIGLYRSLVHETPHYGVKLHLVVPGFVRTQIFQNAMYRNYSEAAAMKSIQSLGLPMLETGKAARAILKGVNRGKGVIMLPFYARLFAFMAQRFPFVLRPFHWKLLAGCPESKP